MKCPKCNKEVDYVNFSVPVDPCTGTIKVDDDGNLSEVPDFDPDDMTSVPNDPIFRCSKCHEDITEHIPNAYDEFERLADEI